MTPNLPETPTEATVLQPTPMSPSTEGTVAGPSPQRGPARAAEVVVPGYEILEELGRGGMGVVYRAKQTALLRIVALKMVLSAEMASDHDLRRFQSEAEAVAQLQHPNIVQLYEVGSHQGRPFFTLEFLPGGDLSQRLKEGPLPAREAAVIVRQLADGMAYAHERGFVHRDLKPANVLFGHETGAAARADTHTGHSTGGVGRSDPAAARVQRAALAAVPKITDFGLVKQIDGLERGLTVTGAIMGTPTYMSPEQARGNSGDIGPSTDIYALGVILYQCLTATVPFRGATIQEMFEQIWKHEPVSPKSLLPSVPADLCTICLKCLEKDPAKRYATAAELADDLGRYLADQPILARPIRSVERAVKWVKRNKAFTASALSVALALTVGLGIATYEAIRADREAVRANGEAIRANERETQARELAGTLEVERNEAERASAINRIRSVRLAVSQGTSYLDKTELGSALLWYAKGWELDSARPEVEDSHRLRTGNVLQMMPPVIGVCLHSAQVDDAVFSPDSKTILTRPPGKSIYLWNYRESRLEVPAMAHTGDVVKASFCNRGNQIASVSTDKLLTIRDARSGLVSQTIALGSAPRWMAVSQNGSRLAVAGTEARVRLYEVGGSGHVREAGAIETGDELEFVAFDPEGHKLVGTRPNPQGGGRVWNVETGEPLTLWLAYQAITEREKSFSVYVRWPVFSPDGSRLSFVSSQTVRVVDFSKPKPTTQGVKMGYYAYNVMFAGDNESMFVCSGTKTSRVSLGTPEPKVIAGFQHPREAGIGSLTRKNDRLATVSTGGVVHLWDVGTGEELWQQRTGCTATTVAFSPDQTKLMIAGWDGSVRVWDIAPRSQFQYYAFDCGGAERVVSRDDKQMVRYHPNGRDYIEYTIDTKEARLLSRDGKREALSLTLEEPVSFARYSRSGERILTISVGNRLDCWDANTGKRIGQSIAANAALRSWVLSERALSFDRSGRRFALVEADDRFSVWDFDTGERVFGPTTIEDDGPRVFDEMQLGQIDRLAISPDGKYVAAAVTSSGKLWVWDTESKRLLHQTSLHRGYVAALEFSPDNRSLLLGCSDTLIRVYDTATGNLVGPPLPHFGFVRSSHFAPDSRRIVSRDGNAIVRIWDGFSGDQLLQRKLSFGRLTDLWLTQSMDAIILSFEAPVKLAGISCNQLRFPIPHFRGTTKELSRLVELNTGQYLDSNEGIEYLDPFAMRKNPAPYREAWLNWRGLKDQK